MIKFKDIVTVPREAKIKSMGLISLLSQIILNIISILTVVLRYQDRVVV